MFGSLKMWGKENKKEKIEVKEKWRKIKKNKFKIDKLFVYASLNLFYLFFRSL